MRDNHHICDITFDTPIDHKQDHKAPKGTAYSCDECGFSALNRGHLRKHKRRNHQEVSCNTCDFKTRNERHMVEHNKDKRSPKFTSTPLTFISSHRGPFFSSLLFLPLLLPLLHTPLLALLPLLPSKT